jgi:hypothetical protein
MSLRHTMLVARVSLGSLCAALAAGCSAHQAIPATPVDTAATPTQRSSVNSYDQPNTPFFTQPGVNGGTPAVLPVVADPDKYDQNAPLAIEVYGAVQQKIGTGATRYLTVQSKGSTILIGGTAGSSSALIEAVEVAKSAKGVSKVNVTAKVASG